VKARLFAGFLLAFALGTAHADFAGVVVAVVDGDTVDVLVNRQPVRVRLAEIDAPEKGQAFGTRARQALAAAVFRNTVTVKETGRDGFGRTLGTITLDGRNINRVMVAEGWAWAYRHYLKDRSLLDVEASARSARAGLWADSNPIAPWDWRRERRGR